MTTIVFCNIGNRDVSGFNPDDLGCREHGRLLLDRLKNGEDLSVLEFPIIQPSLDFVLDLCGFIDTLILFATDQDDPKFNDSDTINYANVLKVLLKNRFPNRVGEIIIEPISGFNPSYYDMAFRFYNQKLSGYLHHNHCFVLVSGGIPACNVALMLHGLILFDERCHVIYQAQGSQPMKLPIGHVIIRPVLARERLEQFDFGAALGLLSGQLAPNSLPLCLLNYACARLWFDFAAARDALESAIMAAFNRPELQNALSGERKILKQLDAGDPKALMGELYYNARIAWDNGRYVDFLGRAIRFQHAAILYLVGEYKIYNKDITSEKLAAQPDFRESMLNNLNQVIPQQQIAISEEIRRNMRLLFNQTYSLSELDSLLFDLGINRENISGNTLDGRIIEIIEYMERRSNLPQLIREAAVRRPEINDWQQLSILPNQTAALVPILQRLERLIPLRDKSIIAHGYDGVSEKILEQYYGRNEQNADHTNPAEDMAWVCQALNIPTENPFRQVAAWITAELSAEINQ